MSKIITTSFLVCIIAICVYLIWYTFKNYNNKKGVIVFRQLLFTIGFHALVVLASIYLLRDNLLLNSSSPFFLFYGLYFYFFINSIASGNVLVYKDLYFNKYFFISSFFTSGYIFLAIVSNELSSSFIYQYFYFLFATEGLLMVYYSIKVFYLLAKNTQINEFLRLNLMAINMLLLFIGVLLASFVFLDFSYFTLYRSLLVICVLCLVIYFLVIYRIIFKQLNVEIVINSNVHSDFQFIDSKLSIDYVPESVINTEIIHDEESVSDVEKDNKYSKSRVSDDLFEDYTIRITDTLLQEKLYLDQDFTLDDLSEVTKISKHHLGQYFSSVHNSNFNKFINQLRVEFIIEYIHSTKDVRLNVNDLLAISPFKSRASFFRNFKEVTGIPPSDFLKAYYESSNIG